LSLGNIKKSGRERSGEKGGSGRVGIECFDKKYLINNAM
jgi:hypothetical protein